jgi:hypothetical protein
MKLDIHKILELGLYLDKHGFGGEKEIKQLHIIDQKKDKQIN